MSTHNKKNGHNDPDDEGPTSRISHPKTSLTKFVGTSTFGMKKVLHTLEDGMTKLSEGIEKGIEKAAKSVTETTKAAVSSTTRNATDDLRKSQGSKRVGLYESDDDFSANNTVSEELFQLDLDNYNDVNNIKFQAHDFLSRGDNNFYKHYHLGKLFYKTEWCRIHLCRSYLTKRDRVVKIVRETCGSCHEFDVLKDTDHPNLPIMFELFQGKDFEFFIVMKYCEGSTLLNFLNGKQSRLNPLGGIQYHAGAKSMAVVKGGAGVLKGGTELITGKATAPNETNKHSGSLPGYGPTHDNQWDLALGKRGSASKSPQRNARSPTRRDPHRNGRSPTRRSPTRPTHAGTKDTSPDNHHHNNGDNEASPSNSPLRSPRGRKHHHHHGHNKKSPLSEEDAKMIMLQLLSCVRYCHDNGIVHCDIKPGNIMLNYPNDFTSITLIDFDTSFHQESPDDKITYQRATGTGLDAAYLAPEVVQPDPCYDAKSDIWSCGVTLYKMLSNALPFMASEQDTEETIRQNILHRPRITFPDHQGWDSISEEAKDYIKFLLHPRPFERPCARQAVNHQWLASARDRMQEVLEEKNSGAATILHNIRHFNTADTKMKEAVCAFIASHLLTKEEVQPIDRVFKALDTQHDGKIRRYEMKQAFYRVFNRLITDKELDKIMNRIDLDGNQEICYSEFSMAAVNKKDLLSHKRLKKAFDLFDKQNKGYVTHDELREAFRFVQMDINYLNKIIQNVDKDGDGKITFAEFVVMMTNSDLHK